MFINKVLVVIGALLNMIFWVHCSPTPYDAESAATGGHSNGGRVQIKVFRGPTEHNGHESFAPWGYWVKQPSDDER